MTLPDIDDGAAKQRLRAIAAANKAALDARVRQAAELAERARAAAEREEVELMAVLARKAEAEAARPAAGADEQQVGPKKPTTLALGADEFKLDREARQAAARTEPQAAHPAEKGRTLKLGAQGEPAEAPARERPTRGRRSDADDDLSGRTWLR